MQNNKKNIRSKVILVSLIIALLLIYLFVPSVNALVNKILNMFATGDFGEVKKFINQYGAYAMLVSALLMIFQSVMAPLPAFLITFANASLFGWVTGAILSWSSAMVGAALCYYISKILGRDVVIKLTSKSALKSVDEFFEKYGKHSILIARLLPFMSFDIVSYAAGLTSIKFGAFIFATGLGQLPATIIYSYVGGMLTGGAKILVTGLLILFSLSVLTVIFKKMHDNKKASEKEKS